MTTLECLTLLFRAIFMFVLLPVMILVILVTLLLKPSRLDDITEDMWYYGVEFLQQGF